MNQPNDGPESATTRPAALQARAVVGMALAAAAGAGAVGAWGRVPDAAWWAGLLLAAVLLGLLARRAGTAAAPPAMPPAPDGLAAAERERLAMLERRARQFDEAELLVAVGSYDWWPARDDLHWSEQHFRLWGYAPGAVVPSFEVYKRHLHPDDTERVVAELQAALDGRGTYDCLHRVLRDDGSVRHVRARGEVFFDAQGRAERMIGAVLDITDRVEAEARLRLHAFVLDALPDSVSVVDAQRQYRLTNDTWHEWTGIRRCLTDPLRFEHVFPIVTSPERWQAFTTCMDEGRLQVVRGHNPAAPHSGRIIETRYLPFRDPAVAWHGVLMMSRDVTDDEALRQRLTHSVDNLSLTLNTIGDAIFATDAQGPDEPVLFANEQLRQLWHIAPDQEPLTARCIIDHARRFFADPAAALARVDAIITGNLAAEDRLELTDGRVIQRRCMPTTRGGRDVRIWIFRDITAEARAQRELAAAEARQRALLEAFPGYIWVFDAEQRVAYLNPRAAAVYAPLVPHPGMTARELFGDEIHARLQPAINLALSGEAVSFEWRRVHEEQRLPDVLLVSAAPGRDADGRPMCHAFGVDITSLQQAREALRAAKEDAERANEAKTRFLSAMSHELRTPLNAVIGFSQVLAHNGEGNLLPRQARQVDEIRKAGEHLLALINDLLDLARVESGHVTLELAPVALAPLAEECLQLVQPQAQARGCRLQPQRLDGAVVRADRMRLKQVLLNLLSNAVKFNRAGGRIWLLAHDVGESLRIEVRDEGPGLSAEGQARLFRPFERLGADGAGILGTGIGLALSRQLVVAMQGRIGVDSQPGQGSSFWVDLPRVVDDRVPPAPARLAPEPLAADAAEAGTDLALPALRVVYVDDNPVNLMLMEGLFEGHTTCRLAVFADPHEALQRLQQLPHDLVLLDLQMPDMDGFAFFERLRAEATTRHLPVVAVSADATSETVARCRELGFAGHVAKPVDVDELLAAVARALAGGAAAT
jgi:PAS domain S-box-containing protein